MKGEEKRTRKNIKHKQNGREQNKISEKIIIKKVMENDQQRKDEEKRI